VSFRPLIWPNRDVTKIMSEAIEITSNAGQSVGLRNGSQNRALKLRQLQN
jgi:hypothetical protein